MTGDPHRPYACLSVLLVPPRRGVGPLLERGGGRGREDHAGDQGR